MITLKTHKKKLRVNLKNIYIYVSRRARKRKLDSFERKRLRTLFVYVCFVFAWHILIDNKAILQRTNLHAFNSTASSWSFAMTAMIDRCPISIKLTANDKIAFSVAMYIIFCHSPPSLGHRKHGVKNTVPIKCHDFLLPSFRDSNGMLILSTKNAVSGADAPTVISPNSVNQPVMAAERPSTFMKKTNRNEKRSWWVMLFITWPTPHEKRWRSGLSDFKSASVFRQHNFDAPMF